MMLHVLIDGPDGKVFSLGAILVDAAPKIGDVVEIDTNGDEPAKLEVLETHHTSKRLSTHFSEETDWAYCRRL